MTANPPKPKVFISYAHESEAFREQVRELADWLGRHGCEMLTDHPYRYRAPAKGWQPWMLECIQLADLVLVICTQKLRAGFEKTGPQDSGFGSTYESVILTQHLYDDAMRNHKVFPILPDKGDRKNIPIILRSWENGHCFPSGNENILRMILQPLPQADDLKSVDEVDGTVSKEYRTDSHEQKVIDLLESHEAKEFADALRKKFFAKTLSATTPQNAEELVIAFSQVPPEKINQLFIVIRQVLKNAPHDSANRGALEQAAVALYCLAARRLVCQEKCRLEEKQHRAYDLIFNVPEAEILLVAIIANAVIGGKLRFEPSENAEIPNPSYAYEVDVSGGTELVGSDFERALYCAIYKGYRRVMLETLVCDPLTEQQRDDLLKRVETIREVDEETLTLVVRGLTSHDGIEPWVTDKKVPVFLASPELTTAVLNVTPTKLLAGIKEFWRELHIINQPDNAVKPDREKPSTPRDAPMTSSTTINQHFHGPVTSVAMPTGDHSQTTVHQTQAVDLSALAPLARELLAAIDELGAGKARDKLLPQAEQLLTEAEKGSQADRSVIKDRLEAIKDGADYIEAGGTIAKLCAAAYELLGPVLGLS